MNIMASRGWVSQLPPILIEHLPGAKLISAHYNLMKDTYVVTINGVVYELPATNDPTQFVRDLLAMRRARDPEYDALLWQRDIEIHPVDL